MNHQRKWTLTSKLNLILMALVLLASSNLNAQESLVVFQNVKLFDGETFYQNAQITIQNGQILEVQTETIDKAIPENATSIDGTGCTLLPGLIDSHTHAYFESQLQQAAMFGVTTELDMMSMPMVAASFRTQQKDGKARNRADYYSAGAAVTVKNGHGTQFGFAVPTLANAEEAAAFVDERIREGSDYIKIIYENGKHFGGNLPTLTPEMLKAAIQSAQAKGKLAVCHIGGFEEAQQAIEFGANGLVHLCADAVVTDEFVKKVKAGNQFVVPTAAVVSNVAGSQTTDLIGSNDHVLKMLTAENLANLQRTFPKRAESKNSWENLSANINKLYEGEVTILAGTDAPNPGTIHGASMMHEIQLLVRAGLDNQTALRAATANPADCFQLNDRGRIKEGLRADLILVKGNPAEKISDICNVVRVWKAGQEIDLARRMEQVALQKEKAANTTKANESLLVSSFDNGDMEVSQGAGWSDSTDAIMGGTSTVELNVIEGGANETSHSVQISGNCRQQQPSFAGLMYSPGSVPMQKADLSAYKSISFWAKGERAQFDLLLFTQKSGFRPLEKTFEVAPDWKQYKFSFAEFSGSDGSDVLGIYFGSSTAGDFQFQLDEVELSVD